MSARGGAPSVLVMAGGEGRRLGHLTDSLPKPMLPVLGRPFLQGVLERLRDQGVRRVHLAVHYRERVIREYFGDGGWLGLDLHYLVERQPLGTAGALALMPVDQRPVLVLNGDVAACVPVSALTAHHERSGSAITVGYSLHHVQIPFGVVQTTGARVSCVVEKPELTFPVLAGVYLVAPWIARTVPPDHRTDMPDLITRAIAESSVSGYPLPGPWLDIGTSDAYARAAEIEGRLVSPDDEGASPGSGTPPAPHPADPHGAEGLQSV